MKRLLISIILIFSCSPSLAFYSTLDDGNILGEGEYRANLMTQFPTAEHSGINLSGRFDHWWNEELQVEAQLGTGSVDFQIGGFVKWVPVPDYDNQPALGLKAGILYGSYEDLSEVSLRLHPLISKGFDTEVGRFTPYGSIPIGMRFRDSEIELPAQLTLGSFYKYPDFEKVMFSVEVAFNLNNAFGYILFGANLEIDDEEGVVFR